MGIDFLLKKIDESINRTEKNTLLTYVLKMYNENT